MFALKASEYSFTTVSLQPHWCFVLQPEGEDPATTLTLGETLWVMRSNYGASDADILRSLQQFSRHPSVTIGTGSEQAAEFLRLWAAGLDPEDAAHIAFVADAAAFVTFDKDLSKRAKKAGSTVPVELAR